MDKDNIFIFGMVGTFILVFGFLLWATDKVDYKCQSNYELLCEGE